MVHEGTSDRLKKHTTLSILSAGLMWWLTWDLFPYLHYSVFSFSCFCSYFCLFCLFVAIALCSLIFRGKIHTLYLEIPLGMPYGGDLFLPILPQKTPHWREMGSGLKQRCLSCQICAQPFQGKLAGQVTVWGAPHTSCEITVSPGGGTGPAHLSPVTQCVWQCLRKV